MNSIKSQHRLWIIHRGHYKGTVDFSACGTVLAADAAGYLLKSTRRRELLLLIGT
jgi:hypothetical protein